MRARRSISRLVLWLCLPVGALVGALSFSAPVLAGECPNEQIRVEQGTTQLPDCRAYEMVSPPYKGGFGATDIKAVAPNGESVAFYSSGGFNGAPSGLNDLDYVAFRGASGWSTLPEMPPASLLPYHSGDDVSSTLSEIVVLGKPGPSDIDASVQSTVSEFVLHATHSLDTEAGWDLAGPLLQLVTKPTKIINPGYLGASADLCHLFVASSANTSPSSFLPEPGMDTERTHPYEVNRGCHGEPTTLKFVGVNGKGKVLSPACNEVLGGRFYELKKESTFNEISEHGGEVFLTTTMRPGCDSNAQLFVRLGGERTLEVSRPLSPACSEVPCAGAEGRANVEFVGASRDGSRVFFRTTAPLTGEGEADELYMAKIGCASGEGEACEPAETRSMKVIELVRVSRDPHVGEASEVQGVVRVAPDGSRVYFVAGGVLSQAPNTEGGVPLRGAENLYVYEPVPGREGEYETVFVADLCSGPELSGSVQDTQCPGDLEGEINGRNDRGLWEGARGWGGQTAGLDGGFLVFSTYAHLTTDDVAQSAQLYRYDAHSGLLNRVSLGEDGYDANGNGTLDASIANVESTNETVAALHEMGTRAITEDGSRIVFTTAEPLSERATNGLANVYEWHEGSGDGEGMVSLISSGSATQPDEDAVISPEGRDIFFVTSQGLLPQDTDGAADVYDARSGGGFPPAAAPDEECSGDGCQGPLTNPAPLLVPGSVVQAPGENVAPMVAKPTVKGEGGTWVLQRPEAAQGQMCPCQSGQ
jgi:hypothetical protein